MPNVILEMFFRERRRRIITAAGVPLHDKSHLDEGLDEETLAKVPMYVNFNYSVKYLIHDIDILTRREEDTRNLNRSYFAMPLVNIARDDVKPYFVDSDDITGLHQHISEENGKQKNELSIYNSQGQLAWVNADSFNLDAETAIVKLREAGVPMVKFPIRWPDNADSFKEYVHYINPEAVTFATVSKPGKDGEIGAIVGVKGVGWEESYGTKPEELDELMNTVRAVKNLKTFTPDVAEARWSGAAMLYIDTASVIKVRDDGYQVNVDFIGSGSLDVQVPRADVNVIANEIYQGGKDTRNLNEIFAEAQAKADAKTTAARIDFAHAVASGNPALINLSTASQATYITKDAIGTVSFYDDERSGKMLLRIAPQKLHSNHHVDTLTLRFNTAAERQQVANRIVAKPQARGFTL